jgi:hypothetical protein
VELGSCPPAVYRVGHTAHSTDINTSQNTDRIDRISQNMPILRILYETIAVDNIARNLEVITRKHKYRPRYRPHNKS